MSTKSFIKKIVASAACIATLAVPFSSSVSAASLNYKELGLAKGAFEYEVAAKFIKYTAMGKGTSLYSNDVYIANRARYPYSPFKTSDELYNRYSYFYDGGAGSFIHFHLEDNLECMLGDLNDDKKLDAQDTYILSNFIYNGRGLSSNRAKVLADVNGDDAVNSADLSALCRDINYFGGSFDPKKTGTLRTYR